MHKCPDRAACSLWDSHRIRLCWENRILGGPTRAWFWVVWSEQGGGPVCPDFGFFRLEIHLGHPYQLLNS
jgi:hypothetical protein